MIGHGQKVLITSDCVYIACTNDGFVIDLVDSFKENVEDFMKECYPDVEYRIMRVKKPNEKA